MYDQNIRIIYPFIRINTYFKTEQINFKNNKWINELKNFTFPVTTCCKINIIIFNFNSWKRSEILQLYTYTHTCYNSLGAVLHVRG